MLDPLQILKARSGGETRYCLLHHEGGMAPALSRFGLRPDSSRLTELDEQSARDRLKQALWKDAAYGVECMTESEAGHAASRIIDAHGNAGSRFYSNHDPAYPGAWHAMTAATYDTGIIIVRPDGIYVCIWFEDED